MVDMKFVRIEKHFNDLLIELAAKRLSENEVIHRKKDVLADLILQAHKKECKP